MTTALAEPTGVSNPMVLIQAAIDKGMVPDQLGKLMDLSERWEKNQAAKAFAEALTDFQAEMPQILKERKATGKMTFGYAALDDIMKIAGPILARCGIVVTFTTEPVEPKSIKATCRIRVGIHHEETTITLPIPAGHVNDTQLFGQAVTYAKRYALCAALNIVVTDEDTDGGPHDPPITDEQLCTINDLIADCADAGNPVDVPRFKAWLDVKDLADLPYSKLAKALDTLKRKKAGKR